jgi:hypothetical protein
VCNVNYILNDSKTRIAHIVLKFYENDSNLCIIKCIIIKDDSLIGTIDNKVYFTYEVP